MLELKDPVLTTAFLNLHMNGLIPILQYNNEIK